MRDPTLELAVDRVVGDLRRCPICWCVPRVTHLHDVRLGLPHDYLVTCASRYCRARDVPRDPATGRDRLTRGAATCERVVDG